MLRPERRLSPVPNEALKRFLLHEDPMVRELVAFYFHESWSLDEGLVPLVLEGCRRYGEEASFVPLSLAERFPLTASSLLESVMELERSQPPFVEDWLARAPLSLVKSHEDLLRSALSFSALARLERRRGLKQMSTTELWQKLALYASYFEKSGFEREHWKHLEDLLDALATRETRQAVVERFHDIERIQSVVQCRALIGLAGSMKLYEVTRTLVDLLGHKEDALAEAASEALSRLGSPACVRLLHARYRKSSWSFRLYAIGALQAMKFPSSETLLRALVGVEEEPALRGRIFDALRFHFTDRAGALMRSELREPTSWMLPGELEKALYVHARILGRQDDEAGRFRQDMEREGDTSIFLRIPVMERLAFDEPCPCGSGQTYEACCGTHCGD